MTLPSHPSSDDIGKTTAVRRIAPPVEILPANNSSSAGLQMGSFATLQRITGRPPMGQSESFNRNLGDNQSTAAIVGSVGAVLFILSAAGLAIIAVFLRSHSIKKGSEHLRPQQDRPDPSRHIIPAFFSFTETMKFDTRPDVGYDAAKGGDSLDMPITSIHCREDVEEEGDESLCSSMESSRTLRYLEEVLPNVRDIKWFPDISGFVDQHGAGETEEESQPRYAHRNIEEAGDADVTSDLVAPSIAMADCLVDLDDMSSSCVSATRVFKFPSLKPENYQEQSSTWSADIILMCRNLFYDGEDHRDDVESDGRCDDCK